MRGEDPMSGAKAKKLAGLVLGLAAGLSLAANPETESPPQSPPVSESPCPPQAPAVPAVLPPLAHPPAVAAPEGLWANLVALHNAYAVQVNLADQPHEEAACHCLHVFTDASFYYVEPVFETNPAYTF